MRNIKIAIIICIILIIIISILLLLLNKESVVQKDNNINNETILAEDLKFENEEINTNLQKVRYKNVYYAIQKCVNQYITYINNENNMAVYSLLNEEYIRKYNINSNNIFNFIKDTVQEYHIDDMYAKQTDKYVCTYYIFGKTQENTAYNVVVTINSLDLVFSIIPNEYLKTQNINGIEDIDKIEILSQKINISDYNTYYYDEISDKTIIDTYINNYKYLIKNNISMAYDMLNKEYASVRFSRIQDFEDYIEENKQNILNIEIEKYYAEEYEDYNLYTCKDKYGNTYIFKETAIMEYTVQLDDYTLNNEEFNEKYNEVNDRDKGILNIDKFFKMINMQDYTSAYSLLDNNFKQNYFKTQEEFENYIKNKLFRYNKVDYKEYSNKITDIYTYKLIVTDTVGGDLNQVEFNIVMKFLEGTDFVMSFEVN